MSRHRSAASLFAAGVLAAALLPGCSKPQPAAPADAEQSTPRAAETAKGTAAASPRVPEALPFIDNDAPKAIAEAKARKVPVFVDVWAPW